MSSRPAKSTAAALITNVPSGTSRGTLSAMLCLLVGVSLPPTNSGRWAKPASPPACIPTRPPSAHVDLSPGLPPVPPALLLPAESFCLSVSPPKAPPPSLTPPPDGSLFEPPATCSPALTFAAAAAASAAAFCACPFAISDALCFLASSVKKSAMPVLL